MVHRLHHFLQKRKSKLSAHLKQNSESISIEKQHQMKGAIDELDTIHKVIQEHKVKQVEKELNPDEVFLYKPLEQKGFMGSMVDWFKDFF